jgi:hypothetical protein
MEDTLGVTLGVNDTGSNDFQLPSNILCASPGNDKVLNLVSPATSNSIVVSSASPITASTTLNPSPTVQTSAADPVPAHDAPSDVNLQMRRRHWEIVLAGPVLPICALPRRARGNLNVNDTRELTLPPPSATAVEDVRLETSLNNSKSPKNVMRRKSDLASASQPSWAKRSASYPSGKTSSLLETMTGTVVPLSRRNLQPSTELSTSVSGKLMDQRDRESLPVTVLGRKQKRFQCQYCGSTFAQRGDMTRHIRVKGVCVCVPTNV